MNKTIVVADDHPIFRRGLVEMILAHGNYKVVAEAGNGAEAIEAILKHHPDFAILDISMPVMDGFDVLTKGMTWANPPAFIMLTMYDDKPYLDKALEYGAKGYLLKDLAEEDILHCLEMVGQGRHYLSPGVAHHLLGVPQAQQNDLSPTERKVLMLVSDYKTNAEIAELLSASVRTIENHRAHICKKLGLHGPHALAQYLADQNKTT
ncbi:MAG: response regulator transcription factor [Arenicellales bacterium]